MYILIYQDGAPEATQNTVMTEYKYNIYYNNKYAFIYFLSWRRTLRPKNLL